MAVTIQTEPQTYTPSDNPVTWTFSSDQTAQANFYFQVDVRINAVLHSSHRIVPEVGSYAHFDASEIARASCSPPERGQTSLLADASNSCTVQLVVYEYYGTPVSLGASASTSTINAFKACLRTSEFADYDYQDYFVNLPGTKLPLTSRPSGVDVYVQQSTEEAYLTFITESINTNFTIDLYEADGTSVATWSDTGVTTDDVNLMRVDPTNIVSNTTLTDANFTASDYYEITIQITAKGTITQRYYIDRTCHQLVDRRLYWLDRYGGIESYTFKMASRISGDVQKFDYQRQWGRWNGTSYEYSNDNAQKQNYLTRSTEKIEISSDWVEEEEYNWLSRSLQPSPRIFMIDEDGTWYVNISGGYQLKYRLTDPLFQYKASLDFGYVNYSPVI